MTNSVSLFPGAPEILFHHQWEIPFFNVLYRDQLRPWDPNNLLMAPLFCIMQRSVATWESNPLLKCAFLLYSTKIN